MEDIKDNNESNQNSILVKGDISGIQDFIFKP